MYRRETKNQCDVIMYFLWYTHWLDIETNIQKVLFVTHKEVKAQIQWIHINYDLEKKKKEKKEVIWKEKKLVNNNNQWLTYKEINKNSRIKFFGFIFVFSHARITHLIHLAQMQQDKNQKQILAESKSVTKVYQL